MSKQNPTRPFKGMITDSSPLDQPKGSYTMAWNAMNEASDGENNFLSNEQSNEFCGNLPSGYTPIGDVYISDGNTVIFSTDGTNSEIGIIDSECNYVSHVNDNESPCLGFKITNQIDAIFRLRRGCERVIYFTDGVNPVRFFNFETPDDFRVGGVPAGDWNCELFKLFLDFNQPDFLNFEIKEQGVLRSGTYSFAIQYLDNDLNPTAWSYVTLPIPVFRAQLNSVYSTIIGSSNTDVDSLGGTGKQTGKSITINLDNLDSNYTHYRFAVIAATSSSGTVTNVYASYEIPIIQTQFTYDGNLEGFTEVALSEIVIPPIDVDSAQHIEQLENKLILANVKGKQVNYCDFQQKASKITSKYVVQSGAADAIENGNSKDPSTYWASRGYMGDEVYAFGIVYVFNDGTESPAFHIPGRGLQYDCTNCIPPSAGVLRWSVIKFMINGVFDIPQNHITGTRITINYDGATTAGLTYYQIIYKTLPSGSQTYYQPGDPGTGWFEAVSIPEYLPGGGANPEYPIVQINSIKVEDNHNTVSFWYVPTGSQYMNLTTGLNQEYMLYTKTYTLPSASCASDPITSWNYNMQHLVPDSASYTSGDLKQWQIYNTAIPTSSNEGYMAYWESANVTYPTLLDCNGSSYWGNDACGDALVGEKIRHHKFPDRYLIEHIKYASVQAISFNSEVYFRVSPLSGVTTLANVKTMFATFNSIATSAVIGTTTIDLSVTVSINGAAGVAVTVQVPFQVFEDNYFIGMVPSPSYWTPFDVFISSYVYQAATPPAITGHVATLTAAGAPPLADANSLGIAGPLTYSIGVVESASKSINAQSIIEEEGIQVQNLGIKFENIEYPHVDIVGHYIVRGERDEFNRTVLAKGITNSLLEATESGVNYTAVSYLQGSAWKGAPTNAVQVGTRSDNYNYLITPRGLLANDPPKGAYIKQEQMFDNSCTDCTWTWGNVGEVDFDDATNFGAVGGSAVFDFAGTDKATMIGTRKITYRGMRGINPSLKIRPIFKNLILDGLAYDTKFVDSTTEERMLYNLSNTNKAHVIHISSDPGDPGIHGGTSRDMPYVSIKIDRDVHPNLESIKYYRTHNSLEKGSASPALNSTTVFGGDVIIGPLNYGNTMFYAVTFSNTVTALSIVLSSIILISAIIVSIFTYGAASISIPAAIIACTAMTGATVALAGVSIGEALKHLSTKGLGDLMGYDDEFSSVLNSNGKSALLFCNEFLEGIFIESEYNLGLRQKHTGYEGGDFYRSGDIRYYFRDKLMLFNDNWGSEKKDRWIYRGTAIPEVYHYNLDFSKINNENVYMSLPASWDCCSDCIDQHPTRIHHSQQSFQEENTDNFRIFLANDYKDIEGEKGEITNIFRKGNSLYIHTEESLWLLPQNMQERITGEFLSFIGTGEYFSIPPRLIQDDEIGTTGTRHKWATIKTDAGIFFIDEASKGVYLIGAQKGLTRISDRGMKADFKKMLVPYFCEQYYVKTGFHFPNKNNPANPHGVGYHVVYDTKYSRIIFTKRDYLIDEAYIDNFSIVTKASGDGTLALTPGNLIFSTYNNDNYFATVSTATTYTEIAFGLGNPTYFEDKSWTISYDLVNNSWTSMHSYLPLYYYYIHDKFYSFKNTSNNIYKHNKVGHYQTFYSVLYPHIIEYVSLSSPVMTRIWDEVMLQVVARIYDVVKQQYAEISDDNTRSDRIFNKAVFYNSTQCSGELNLTIKDNADKNYLVNQILDSAANFITISRDERNWKLNEIRDYRSNYTKAIWTEQWSSIKTEYPIDKVLNTNTIDFDKIWTDLQLLRDKYLIIRLIFDNLATVNLITNYSFERETPSIR